MNIYFSYMLFCVQSSRISEEEFDKIEIGKGICPDSEVTTKLLSIEIVL